MTSAEERWYPDEALVLTLETRSLEMRHLSGPDRSWVVASLTVKGWTVAAIADRLRCSLRLVQTIKTEPMTQVALYALALADELASERAAARLAQATAATQARLQADTITRLSGQRDALLGQVQRLTHPPAPPVPRGRRRPGGGAGEGRIR